MAEELDYSRVERIPIVQTPIDVPQDPSRKNRPSRLNFIAMILVAIALDIGSVLPVIGGVTDILSGLIFIPWFYFSGMKFTGKRIGLMGVTTIFEAIPVVQMGPFITLNVIASYWMNGN